MWAENVAAVLAFLACSTQWRAVGLTNGTASRLRVLGLDYAGARAGLDLAGIAVTPALWGDLRHIESGALAEMNGTGP